MGYCAVIKQLAGGEAVDGHNQFHNSIRHSSILVADVMDTVGNLVWNRIKKKAEEDEFDNVVAPLPGDANTMIPRIFFYS